MAKQMCSICSAPSEVRKAVEQQVAKRVKLRDLERDSGFSRSAISRHMRGHVARTVLREHRGKHDISDRRLVVHYAPGTRGSGSAEAYVTAVEGGELLLSADQLQADDLIIHVRFGRAAITNAAALTRSGVRVFGKEKAGPDPSANCSEDTVKSSGTV